MNERIVIREDGKERKVTKREAYFPSSLRTAAAELPTFSTVRRNRAFVMPRCLIQYLTSSGRCIALDGPYFLQMVPVSQSENPAVLDAACFNPRGRALCCSPHLELCRFAPVSEYGEFLWERAWLARHRRWTFHFTPTSASWLNAVETFFARLTRRRLARGVFRSVDELKAAINHFVTETNADPKPFIWTADPRRVLAAVKRGKQALESAH